jgi:hypothetical protein
MMTWTTTEGATRQRECWDENNPPCPEFVIEYYIDEIIVERC